MEMLQLIVIQQALLRYYGNAIWCIDHVTKVNLICHNIYIYYTYMCVYVCVCVCVCVYTHTISPRLARIPVTQIRGYAVVYMCS
jgi:hypothetical protein